MVCEDSKYWGRGRGGGGLSAVRDKPVPPPMQITENKYIAPDKTALRLEC